MVTNDAVIRTLERIAGLLEIVGDNVFKVRAYRLAATQVENLSEQLADIAARDGLRHIDGFGAAIADKVHELVTTGRLGYLEQLEAEVPPTLLAIRELPGVGPRTAAMLWKEAGITTIPELAARARGAGLAGLPRLGAKSIENIVAGLEALEREGAPRRLPRAQAQPLADAIVRTLRAIPGVERCEVAGSYRRGLPDVGDLDILCATAHAAEVLHAFAALPQVEQVLVQGETKCSVIGDGLQIDCRAVTLQQFGAAWQYFTGSQAHNVRLRARALRMGMTLNEYGLFRLDGGERVAGATEEDVYAALGLSWIPPGRRQDSGEIDAAEIHATPPPVAGEVPVR